MSSTTSENGLTGWKADVRHAEECRREIRQRSYELVKTLVRLYHSQDFRVENNLLADSAAEEWLSTFLGELNITFTEVRDIYEAFPDEEHWHGHTLRDMLIRTEDKQREIIKAARTLQKRQQEVQHEREQQEALMNGKKPIGEAVQEALAEAEEKGVDLDRLVPYREVLTWKNKFKLADDELKRIRLDMHRADLKIAKLEKELAQARRSAQPSEQKRRGRPPKALAGGLGSVSQ